MDENYNPDQEDRKALDKAILGGAAFIFFALASAFGMLDKAPASTPKPALKTIQPPAEQMRTTLWQGFNVCAETKAPCTPEEIKAWIETAIKFGLISPNTKQIAKDFEGTTPDARRQAVKSMIENNFTASPQ